MIGKAWMKKFRTKYFELGDNNVRSQLCLKREKTFLNRRLCLVIISSSCVNVMRKGINYLLE